MKPNLMLEYANVTPDKHHLWIEGDRQAKEWRYKNENQKNEEQQLQKNLMLQF